MGPYKGIHQEYPVAIVEELQQLKEIADKQGSIQFLEKLAFMHQYYNALDDNAQTNFDFLMQKIQNSNIEDLYALKVFLETGTDEKSSEAVSKGKQDDLVRVVTIHQSKGLQYQVVFLFSDNQNTDKDSSSLVQIHDDLYLGLKHIDLTQSQREKSYTHWPSLIQPILKSGGNYKSSLCSLNKSCTENLYCRRCFKTQNTCLFIPWKYQFA